MPSRLRINQTVAMIRGHDREQGHHRGIDRTAANAPQVQLMTTITENKIHRMNITEARNVVNLASRTMTEHKRTPSMKKMQDRPHAAKTVTRDITVANTSHLTTTKIDLAVVTVITSAVSTVAGGAGTVLDRNHHVVQMTSIGRTIVAGLVLTDTVIANATTTTGTATDQKTSRTTK